MELLLLSTGGRPLFRHARGELTKFLAGRRRVGFITAASLYDEAAYFARAKAFFDTIGVKTVHIRWRQPTGALSSCDAIVVGGGNTYALLQRLHSSRGLFWDIQKLVQAGTPYIGASAGSNLAGPNILTSNDMNVVGASEFDAFGFVPWNVNPHYPMTKADARGGTTFGETRDERIAEFHRARDPVTGVIMNPQPVVALEEPAIIHVDGSTATVLGKGRVRWISRNGKPIWFSPGDRLPLGRGPQSRR